MAARKIKKQRLKRSSKTVYPNGMSKEDKVAAQKEVRKRRAQLKRDALAELSDECQAVLRQACMIISAVML